MTLAFPAYEPLSSNEVSLAVQLIEGMSASFDPTKYRADTYTQELQKLIEAKAQGQKCETPAPKAARTNVIDLVSALPGKVLARSKRERKREIV